MFNLPWGVVVSPGANVSYGGFCVVVTPYGFTGLLTLLLPIELLYFRFPSIIVKP